LRDAKQHRDQGLSQAAGVGRDWWQVGWHRDVEHLCSLRQDGGDYSVDLLDQRAKRHWLPRQPQVALTHARSKEQVLEQRLEPDRLAAHRPHLLRRMLQLGAVASVVLASPEI
jgi:hypothetical protein